LKLNLPFVGHITVELPYLAGGAVGTLAVLGGLGYWMWGTTPTTIAGGACEVKNNFEVTAADYTEGDPKAPITLFEYASMTCPHCARFNNTVMPLIRKNYIEKGHVRYVFREFPIDQVAMTISVIGRCLPHGDYLPFVDLMFQTQQTWGSSKSAEELQASLKEVARRAGMTGEAFDQCLVNGQKYADDIAKVAQKAQTDYCVQGVPAMFVNGKVFASGELPYAEADKKLREELTRLGKTPPPPPPPEAAPPAATPPAGQPPPEGATPPAGETPAAPAPPAPAPDDQPPATPAPTPQ
jgi:protein-disulfide isomerase